MTVLAEKGPQGRRFVIRLNEFKRHRLLDLRFYYLDKKAQEFRPTSKGINLNKDNYLLARRVLEEEHETIMDWLGIEYVPQHVSDYAMRQRDAMQESASSLGEVVASVDRRERDPTFFLATHEGGTTDVNFNSSHPFYGLLVSLLEGDAEEGGPVWEALEALLAAFSKAAESLAESPATHPSSLFDTLTYNWSAYLASYSRTGRHR